MNIIWQNSIKQSKYFICLTIILLFAVLNVEAEVSDSTPLYLYYFETDDVLLETGQTQAYQFTAFAGEKVTIVVYGLDSLVRPEITLINEASEVAATGRSTVEQPYVRYIQFTANKDETFTFDVSVVEAAEGGGLARVMLVEGEPIDGDLTYLDTINPLLPGRVFMVSGSDEIDTDVTASEVGLRTGAEVLPVTRFREKPDIFVSRGSTEELPPITERFNPNTSHVWFNSDSDKFYFFTVHAIPEQLTSVTAEVEYEALNLLTFFYFDYFFIVGAGSDPVLLSQETQPCSEVTLENRENCERVPPVVLPPAPQTEGMIPSSPPLVVVDTEPPVLDVSRACFFGDNYDYVHSEGNFYFIIDYCIETTRNQYNEEPDALGVSETNTTLYGSEGGDILIGGDSDDTLVGDSYQASVCTPYDISYYYYYYYYYYEYDFNCISSETYYGSGTEGDRTGSFPYPVPADPPILNDPQVGDKIYGRDGSDEIFGGSGDDMVLNGGAGSDLIVGDDATYTHNCVYHYEWYYYYGYFSTVSTFCTHTTIYNGTGDDLILGEDGADTIYGGGGNDEIHGGTGNDIIFGDGAVYQSCTADPDFFSDPAHAVYTLCPATPTLVSEIGSGSDWIEGGSGSDTIRAGAGDDRIIEAEGSDSDTLDGGTGRDTVDYTDYSGDITFNITGTTATVTVDGETDNLANIEEYLAGSGDDDFFISGTFAGTSDSNPTEIAGGAGNNDVTFAVGTQGYFLIAGADDIEVCDDMGCANISNDPADYTGYIGYSTDADASTLEVYIQVVGALPAPAPSVAASSERWNLSGEVGGSFDGGDGDDIYTMGDTATVAINDTGSDGVDTVIYAMNAAALTVTATDEASFTVSDNTTTVAFTGVENISTGVANDIFLLHYNSDGVSNTYDAGENATNTDMDTAVIDTNLDLTVTVTDSMAVVNQTTTASVADTLVNFEGVETGSGNDSFVMNTAPDGKTLNGGGGQNDISYTDNSDTVVSLTSTNSLTVAVAGINDTLLNFDTVTTGDGDDVVNLDLNAASTSTDYTVNASGGFNIFNFIFNGDPLTDTVNVTVAADGTNNVLDFSDVNTTVTVDTSSSSPQEVFTNFWLTIQGVFEVVFGTEEAAPEPTIAAAMVETSTDEDETTEAVTLAAPIATCSDAEVTVSDETASLEPEAEGIATEAASCETVSEPTAEITETLAEVTAEATTESIPEATVEVAPTLAATPEATVEVAPPVEATPEPPMESTPAPEATPEPPPAASTPAPEATEPS
jgi:hypothetical protein